MNMPLNHPTITDNCIKCVTQILSLRLLPCNNSENVDAEVFQIDDVSLTRGRIFDIDWGLPVFANRENAYPNNIEKI